MDELAVPLSCSPFSAEVSAPLVRVSSSSVAVSQFLHFTEILLWLGMLSGAVAVADGMQSVFGNKQTPFSYFFS